MSLTRSMIRGTQWVARIGSSVLINSLIKLRKAAGEGATPKIEPLGLALSEREVKGICCEILTPPEAPKDAVLLYLHGGGGVLGLYNSSRKIIGHICEASGLQAVLVDYRLAPEYPFPCGLEDCVAVYRGLLAEGMDAKRIVILGDSMGGYLTVSMLLHLRENGLPLPAGAVCISPVTDPTCSGESMQTNVRKDALLSPKFMRGCMSMYVGNHKLEDATLSPLTADLGGLPPMLVQVGEHEILLDDAKRLHARGTEQGARITLEIWPRMWHDWHVCAPALQEAMDAIGKIAGFVALSLPSSAGGRDQTSIRVN